MADAPAYVGDKRLQYSINVGVRKHDRNEYLTNYYTRRVGAFTSTPSQLFSITQAYEVFDQIIANGYVYAVIPEKAPNMMRVINRLVSVEINDPVLALNIFIESLDYHKQGDRAVFLSNVKRLDFAPAALDNHLPDGSIQTHNDVIVGFKGRIAPIQNIGGSLGV